jgi:hypothetical protein
VIPLSSPVYSTSDLAHQHPIYEIPIQANQPIFCHGLSFNINERLFGKDAKEWKPERWWEDYENMSQKEKEGSIRQLLEEHSEKGKSRLWSDT